jgi:hypothetical protein
MNKNHVEVQSAPVEQLQKFAERGFLYAVLDATGAPPVPAKAEELGAEKSVSLFADSRQQEYWKYAPYLAKVDNAMLEWIRNELWPTPWGIFVMSNSDLGTVSAHLRKLLRIRLTSGEECIFRYYDPRVLSSYLTSCKAEESANFFGDIRAYAVNENENVELFVRNTV